MGQQPLSLDEPWRLRIGSAQAYTLMKNREIGGFEKVVSFLEATYRILPRLVTPIKHMKIIFGLKTMIIMWIFREGHGVIPTVVKILQLFPSNLPQYQDHCSQQEMSLMKKNQRDFKSLAQSLAMNKDKLDHYIKNQMEEEYGERYAQKLEDRLLHYLEELEAVLPKDTYIDKLLKKESPMVEEESLLLRVLMCDSRPIETSLKRLLQASSAECHHGDRLTPSASQGATMKPPCATKLVLPATSSPGAPVVEHSEKIMWAEGSPLLLDDEEVVEEAGWQQRAEDEREACETAEEPLEGDNVELGWGLGDDAGKEEANVRDGDEEEKESSLASGEYVSSPQFCAKHQCWVRSILQECPIELSLQASSSSSSQDLTPSLLFPSPPGPLHMPSKTPTSLQTAQSGQMSPTEMPGSASGGEAANCAQASPAPPLSSSPKDLLVSPGLSPAGWQNHMASPSEPHHISPPHFSNSSTSLPQPLAHPSCPTSRQEEALMVGPQTVSPPTALFITLAAPVVDRPGPRVSPRSLPDFLLTGPLSPDPPATTYCLRPTRQPYSRLSGRFRRPLTVKKQGSPPPNCLSLPEKSKKAWTHVQSHSPPLSTDSDLLIHSTQAALHSTQSGALTVNTSVPQTLLYTRPSVDHVAQPLPVSAPPPTESSPSSTPRPETCAPLHHSLNPEQGQTLIPSQSSPSDRAQERTAAWQSGALQPYVRLTRLNQQELSRLSARISPALEEDDADEDDGDEEEDDCFHYRSFDLNTLYSSDGSSEHSEDSDLDYLPYKKMSYMVTGLY